MSPAVTANKSASAQETVAEIAPPAAATNGHNGVNGKASKNFGTTSMIESKFLSHPEELGVVAVGFSGGQVRETLSHALTYATSCTKGPALVRQ
jgi:arginase